LNKHIAMDYEVLYDEFWQAGFKKGREDFGDLELTVAFLDKANVLRPNHTILEIGCGIGKLNNYLFSNGFTHLTGTDISEQAISYGKKKYPLLNLLQMDACDLRFDDGAFDAVLSFDLVEHLPQIETHFNEVKRVLKRPGGMYLIYTPNILSNSIIATVTYRSFKWIKYHPSLQFSWTLRKKLKQAGFKEVTFYKIPPLSEFKFKQLSWPVRTVFKSIPWSVIPLFLQTGFYCVAKTGD